MFKIFHLDKLFAYHLRDVIYVDCDSWFAHIPAFLYLDVIKMVLCLQITLLEDCSTFKAMLLPRIFICCFLIDYLK